MAARDSRRNRACNIRVIGYPIHANAARGFATGQSIEVVIAAADLRLLRR